MRLRKVRDVLKQRVEDIENSIIDGFTDLASMLDAERRLEDARTALRHAETKIKAKENALGVDDRTELCKLTQSVFIST
jgi:cob(I)alamin adenosyltransferase